MNWKLWVGIVIGLIAVYYLLNPLFWVFALIFLFLILYRIYLLIERLSTPKGMRIKHGLLRGYLENEYGPKEGGKVYKEMVGEMRKRGYR